MVADQFANTNYRLPALCGNSTAATATDTATAKWQCALWIQLAVWLALIALGHIVNHRKWVRLRGNKCGKEWKRMRKVLSSFCSLLNFSVTFCSVVCPQTHTHFDSALEAAIDSTQQWRQWHHHTAPHDTHISSNLSLCVSSSKSLPGIDLLSGALLTKQLVSERKMSVHCFIFSAVTRPLKCALFPCRAILTLAPCTPSHESYHSDIKLAILLLLLL